MRHRFHRFALLSTLLFTLLLALWGLKQNVNAAPAPLRGGAVPGAANPQSSSLYLPMVLRDFEPGRIPEKLGLVFVNSAEDHRTATRIQRGVVAGADLDRFPLYWHEVETSAGVFDWSDMDQALQDNLAQGLHTMPIFLGTPPFYFPTPFTPDNTVPLPPIGGGPLRDAALPDAPQRPMDNGCTVAGTPPAQNIFQPIFSDGTDIPGPGKTINPNNYWARFIFKAVERYKPGGVAGTEVKYWELWNEPDLCHFFGGTVAEYTRMLKVGYLAIEQADPAAYMLWGGLAQYGPKYENGYHFLNQLVDGLMADPMAVDYDGFFDAPAIHHYSRVTLGYSDKVNIINALSGTPWLGKRIWVTESGVPVCGSYPGPDCPSPYRGTAEEQASYIWQNIAYSRIGGYMGPIFHFQLHDDCGNIPSPTPPADAFGLVTNEQSSWCTPHYAEPRPSYSAYQVAANYLVDGRFRYSDQPIYGMRRLVLEDEPTNERRTLIWAVDGFDVTFTVQALGSEALVIRPDGSYNVYTPVAGGYEFVLPAATNQNFPGSTFYSIGGVPYLVIEDLDGGPAPAMR